MQKAEKAKTCLMMLWTNMGDNLRQEDRKSDCGRVRGGKGNQTLEGADLPIREMPLQAQ